MYKNNILAYLLHSHRYVYYNTIYQYSKKHKIKLGIYFNFNELNYHT